MGKKILVAILLLAGLGCGFFFVAATFQHGFNSGMIRLRRLEGDGILFGVGAIAFLIAAIVSWPRSNEGS